MAKNLLVPLCLLIALSVAAIGHMETDNAGFTDEDLRSEEAMWDLYERWLSQNGVPRNDLGEKLRRFGIFKDNLRYIQLVNQREDSYKLRVNKFADLTKEEFRATYTAGSKLARGAKPRAEARGFMYGNESLSDLPVSVDWREKGAVTPVKNQGSCGSCWAFSTVAAVEGINQIVSKQLVSLSEQELVDCDTKINHGCNGGLMDYAFQFIIENGGISAERIYPYTATDGECDAERKNTHSVVIDGYEDVPVNSDEALTKAVAHQPVSVAIEAGRPDFQFYWKGIFSGECGTDLDHGVAVVGYGVSGEGTKYWIVKNSWGADWGEDGYIRMQRATGNPQGLCGINMEASYPVKTTPTNPSTTLSGRVRKHFNWLLEDMTSFILGRKSGLQSAAL